MEQLKITYLLGAGASYQAIPIVKDMPQAIGEIVSVTQAHLDGIPQNKDNDKKNAEKFIEHLNNLIKVSKDFGTVDTYARKLVLTNDIDKLHELKITISIFFELWQSCTKRGDFFSREDIQKYQAVEKGFLDSRYVSLFSNLLVRQKNKVILNENINILTWNYDTQIARALGLFTEDKSLDSICTNFSIYPQVTKSKSNKIVDSSRILHLNGVAGLFEVPKREGIYSLADRIDPTDSFVNAISKLLFAYNSNYMESIDFGNTFSFAWEKTAFVSQARERAKEILRDTDALVIIGYSFPSFNLEVDRELFEAFNNQKRNSPKFIYYQDFKPDKDIIRDSFGVDPAKIFLNDNTDQFLIPRQFLK